LMSRPEHIAPPEIFYDEEEAKKYGSSSRMRDIQAKMSIRALELLNLPPGDPAFLLDLGCGSGLSGQILEEAGHQWVGLDISPHMLEVAQEQEAEGDLILGDLGDGVPFRPGMFDGAVSISALQWLCNADKRWHVPKKRLIKLFETLYASLRRGARAVFQLYPENSEQVELITMCAMTCGFTGGMVVDFPHSAKAKKYFLVLFAGQSNQLPSGLGTDGSDGGNMIRNVDRQRTRTKRSKNASKVKGKQWILKKKDTMRRQGKDVKRDSKYSGRKRLAKKT